MNKHLVVLLFLVAAACCAQTTAPKNLQFTFPTVTTTGPLGNGLMFDNLAVPRPSVYTIDASVTGTAPTACTFRVEGSSDTVNWYGLDATAPASTPCTAAFMEHIANKPVVFLRINIVTYTAGDGTTSVVFHYTGAP